ncbi:D-alanine--D-alanine ligase [Steroidobacter denitrificans]|uniref:D-alanine--D-alanine ligase n=1 Tax=Steroidobacter denitrificans TaxID=465721 RepID=A0A127F5Y1_STEDE|nr:D-alanine--D-alanine ligase [Steroidobacter denitrificans]AMN45843.1 D-alanine--D-alanine ligase [Steroidobacter denitrificans]
MSAADPAEFGRVAVLMGGSSSERAVSLDSGRNCLAALLRRGVDAYPVDGIENLVKEIAAGNCQRVFNILHGGDGENGVVQGLLEALHVPYTGSGVLGAALTLDKIRTKQVWLSLSLPTPRYACVSGVDDIHRAASELGLPLIVKPACEGSSVGVSRVFREADLNQAVDLARTYPGSLLMEQLIDGEEYTVGILGERALPSIRITPSGEYYDYHAKYVAEDTQYLCPGLQGEAEAGMLALSLQAFRAAGCEGWGRVDLMRDRRGVNYLLEVNTTPGMTSHSLVPKAALAVGIDFDELVWRILATSRARTGAGGSC